jgi:hypothetical protein
LFGKLKKFLRKRAYNNDKQLEKSEKQWLQIKPREGYSEGINALSKRWKNFINIKGGYVEN